MRKQLDTLKELTVQPVTRKRYDAALKQFFAFLTDNGQTLPNSHRELDLVVSDYLERLWAQGAGRTEGSNALAALQDSQPHLKGKLLQSWRLMKTWVVNEVPNRAPPLPLELLEAMVGYASFKGNHLFALSLLLGFFGEILMIQSSQISISHPKGPAVLSPGLTKAGKRQGASESVSFHQEDICRRLYAWKAAVSKRTQLVGSSYAWRKMFNDVLKALKIDRFDFCPYSLRRGGATHFFGLHGSLDRLLLLGRWQSQRAARIYLNEGMAVLAEIDIPMTPFARNLRHQYTRSLTRPLPKLELTPPKKVQNRGSWKKRHKNSPKKKSSWIAGVKSLVSWVWPDQ